MLADVFASIRSEAALVSAVLFLLMIRLTSRKRRQDAATRASSHPTAETPPGT